MTDSIFKNRRQGRAFWLFLPILLFLYMVLFPRPGGKESFLRPVWSIDLSGSRIAAAGAEQPVWSFRSGDRFGYADGEGNLYHLGYRSSNLSLSDSGYFNYGSVPDHVVFMNTRGEFQYSLKSHGYPLLDSSGEALFSIHTDRGGLTRITPEGEILWTKSFATPITTLSPASDGVFCGLMDGRALLLDAQGEVVYRQIREGSRYAIQLGSALADDHLATISGIDPQVLSIVQRRDTEYLTIQNRVLDSDFRREVRLQFSSDSRFLYYEVEGGVGVMDVRRGRIREFRIPGVLQFLDDSPAFAAASFRKPEGSTLLLFRPLDSILFTCPMPGQRPYVRVVENMLILGFEGVLLRADLLKG